jgi:hypothetical protein
MWMIFWQTSSRHWRRYKRPHPASQREEQIGKKVKK